MRAILIPADENERVREVDLPKGPWHLAFKQYFEWFERVSTVPLRDRFTDLDGDVVMVVDEEGRVYDRPYNRRASFLYAPGAEHHRHYIAGDALLVGEGMTEDGLDFVPLQERVGVIDVEELIERYEKR